MLTLDDFRTRAPELVAAAGEERTSAILADAVTLVSAEAGPDMAEAARPVLALTVYNVAYRTLANPNGLTTEQAADYSTNVNPALSVGMRLTAAERAAIRRATGRRTVASFGLTRR
ncbi:hypothetical protein GCM10020229_45840 [Kitasatospora albolonga]|uniref:hypothetical protein n=1 Tax=Kitasatospora albolonga TaxID=68173 RepID=UPI0031E96921